MAKEGEIPEAGPKRSWQPKLQGSSPNLILTSASMQAECTLAHLGWFDVSEFLHPDRRISSVSQETTATRFVCNILHVRKLCHYHGVGR